MADDSSRKVGGSAGNRGLGRKKGVPNRTTATAKSAIELAAEKLGGGERLFAWAQEDPDNEKAFWTSIYPRLLPLKHEGGGPGGAILFQTVYE